MSDTDSETIDLGKSYSAHRVLRPWKPGDGLTCTHSTRASRNRPCGPPVAVKISTFDERRCQKKRNEVICAYHLSQQMRPCDLSAQAERQAREEIIVKYWSEYQEAIERYMKPLVEDTIGDLPEELKLLVLDALAKHDQLQTQDNDSAA